MLTLLLIALAGVGSRRSGARPPVEFPGAKKGDWMQSMRNAPERATTEAGRRIGSAMKGLTSTTTCIPTTPSSTGWRGSAS